VIEINFEQASQIPGEKPRYYLDMPTSFTLSKEQVKKLVAIGPKLLKAAPQYQCMIKVLAAEAESKPRPEECVGRGNFPLITEAKHKILHIPWSDSYLCILLELQTKGWTRERSISCHYTA